MEEGPEPHETIERTVEHHEHAEHAGQHGPAVVPAITAAVLAVLAAVGSLLSGHAANEAILAQSQANDAWSYYQAKSTKRHIYKADGEIAAALAGIPGANREVIERAADRLKDAEGKYTGQLTERIEAAREFEQHSRHEFAKHQNLALAVSAFQVGIVLASISILVRQRMIYALSLVAGLVGLGLLVYGSFFTRLPPPPELGKEEARRVLVDRAL